jgi:RNA ligase (TIGR02306 family)
VERKLASFQIITDILPHPNADKLEIAKILGWQAIVLKGQFHRFEPVVYVETDSILPEGRTEWEFMRDRKFHVKTIKLRGIVSQGLVFHEDILDNPMTYGPRLLGDDVTAVLGITKWEPYVPAQLAGTVKGNFPSFLSKTDEMRIQAVPELLAKHQGKKFSVREKVDGSSCSVYINNDEFGVCSRNLELKETEGNSFWKVARELDIENKLRSLRHNVALQGELCGSGVQGNKYKLDKLGFYIFNAYDIDTGLHFNPADLAQIVDFLGLTSVPFITDSYILPGTVDELVEYSKGKSLLNKDVHREGLVFRPLVNEYSEELRCRLSFKCINPDFLLKYDD